MIKNIEFLGHKYCEGMGSELPVFTIKEPSVEEWNRKARKANMKMFTLSTGRQPKDYNEVLAWIYTPENEENRLVAGTTEAVIGQFARKVLS